MPDSEAMGGGEAMSGSAGVIVSKYSKFESYVQKRHRCSGAAWEPEKRCVDIDEANKYVEEYGERDYKGDFHGDELRAVEIETVRIVRVAETGK